MDLNGKTAFITGGASGLGLAMAHSFQKVGMNVIIADIESAALETALEELQDPIIGMQLDVADRAAVQAAAKEAEGYYGKIHVLCNNAGVAMMGTFAEQTMNDWDWVQNINLTGVANCLNAFLPGMMKHGEQGHVINTASIAGHLGAARMLSYSATKFGVVGLSESLQAELEETPIGVSVLCPGFVKTKIVSAIRNRPGMEEFAKMIPDIEEVVKQLGDDNRFGRLIEVDVVGELVVKAIQQQQFYIFTHPEMREIIDIRYQRIQEGFDWCEKNT